VAEGGDALLVVVSEVEPWPYHSHNQWVVLVVSFDLHKNSEILQAQVVFADPNL
jgi:hypothetical protein